MNSGKNYHSSEENHFYGRRKGRPLHKGRTDAVTSISGQYILSDDILQQEVIVPSALTGHDTNWLEIGFGTGEHLIGQAEKNLSVGIIGCEPFINGVSMAAKNIVEKNLTNVCLWADDAMLLLQKFPPASLDRVFLLFSDPWPKTRHYKRRFIQHHTVALLSRLLKPGGQLRLATDDPSLAEWMLLHTVQNPEFSWDNAVNGDWDTVPSDWVETRYQQKAAEQGRLARFIDFTRL